MEINWTRIKESLYHLDEASGANIDYARGCVVTVASCLTALGMDWKSIWSHLIPNLPDGLRVRAIPSVWLYGIEKDWAIPTSDLVPFKHLLTEIPSDMQKIVLDEYGWTCRDVLLDKYLYVMAIMQREYEGAHARWKEEWCESQEPKLSYFFNPIRHAGSQFSFG